MSWFGDDLFAALALTAVSVAALHSLAPDHWVPFAALARARGWSAARTARVTVLCGFGHVTVSVLLGLLGLFLGVELVSAVGHRMEAVAGLLLIGFGLGYGVWGLRRSFGSRLSGRRNHSHAHPEDVASSNISVWALFMLFAADPCVAVIPLLFAAAPLGAFEVASVALLYELSTIVTMIALVLPARAGVKMFRPVWFERYGDAVAGGVIAAMGGMVMSLGI